MRNADDIQGEKYLQQSYHNFSFLISHLNIHDTRALAI